MILRCCRLQVTLAAWQEFDSQQEAVHEFVNKARSAMERDLNFSSPESLAVELDQARVSQGVNYLDYHWTCIIYLYIYGEYELYVVVLQVLLKQCEAEASHMNTLLRRAKEIQLGPKNKTLLLQRASSLSEQVDHVKARLKQE